MADITFITGGARSGKSAYAQQLAQEWSNAPVYLATARVWDADFQKRIARHKSDRGSNWQNIEEEKNISALHLEGEVVLLDCITLWLTNIFHDSEYDPDASLAFALHEWNRFAEKDVRLIVVSNEIGMGVHPEHESARKFADLQGWMNQHIAKQAKKAVFMVSGIPVSIK